MICPKCKQPVAEGARFCANCGEPTSAAASPDPILSPPPPGAGGAAPGGSAPAWTAGVGTAAPGLVNRIKNILLTPATEWPVIAGEPTSIAQLYTGYVIPLAAFSALMSFIRLSLIGVGYWRMPVLSGLTYALVSFVLGLLGLYAVAWVIDMLAPTFAGQRDRRQALKAAAYASTPGALGAIFALLGGLGVALHLIAAIYGIYLLYLGLPVLMRNAREKSAGYTAAVIVCFVLVMIVVGIVTSLVNPLRGQYSSGLSVTPMTQEEREAQAAARVSDVLAAAAARMQEQQAAANAGGEATRPPAAAASTGTAPAAADAPAANAANAQNGAAATAGVLAALSGAMAGNRHVDPVDFHTLKGLLPDALPGMQRTNAEGDSQGALGMKASSATGDYQGEGSQRAEIKIVDASAVSGLLNVAGAAAASKASESDTGFEKDTTVGGRRVHEKYDNRSKHGELLAIVANRFSVSVSGDGVDVGALEQYAGLVDFSKLEAMKDAGASSPQ